MEFWESGNFEEFKKEVFREVERKREEILENAKRKAKEILERKKREAELLKREKINESLKKLDEEFSTRRKEILELFEDQVKRATENLTKELLSKLLEEMDITLLFKCFKDKVLRKHKKGKFYVNCQFKDYFPNFECLNEKNILFKFEGENVNVVLDIDEIEEILEREIQKLLKGV